MNGYEAAKIAVSAAADPPRHGEVAPRSGDGGGDPRALHSRPTPSTIRCANGPPPRAGEDFTAVATVSGARLL